MIFICCKNAQYWYHAIWRIIKKRPKHFFCYLPNNFKLILLLKEKFLLLFKKLLDSITKFSIEFETLKCFWGLMMEVYFLKINFGIKLRMEQTSLQHLLTSWPNSNEKVRIWVFELQSSSDEVQIIMFEWLCSSNKVRIIKFEWQCSKDNVRRIMFEG